MDYAYVLTKSKNFNIMKKYSENKIEEGTFALPFSTIDSTPGKSNLSREELDPTGIDAVKDIARFSSVEVTSLLDGSRN